MTYFASTIVTQQCEDLILIHVEGQVVDGHLRPESLLQLRNAHRGLAQQLLVYLFELTLR